MIFRRDVKHRIAKKLLENVPNNHFLPYPYQLDLLDTAYERNTIICLSNELTKSFITLSLIREMSHDHPGKCVLYFTQEKNILETARCLARHTGLSVAHFLYQKPFFNWHFPDWTKELLRHHVLVVSPWLIPSLLSNVTPEEFQVFISKNFYLLVVSECHHVLDTTHPYFQLFGPRGLGHFPLEIFSHDTKDKEKSQPPFQRVVCFTSSLLPRESTDPLEAEARMIELEKRTNCRLETASELLTMLSLGARPKERVLLCPMSSPSGNCAVHHFFTRILLETHEFLADIRSQTSEFTCHGDTREQVLNTASRSSYLVNTQAPDSRGRMICVLDYCRRAVIQCEEILSELGVWCASQIARVFVKHLIGLDRRRALLFETRASSEGKQDANQLVEHGEDQLARVLRFTVTQLCMLVRLFQMEFDTCLTLETFQTMISPKILTLVEQLKTYKPSMNFRIEVAELPNSCTLPGTSRKARQRRRNRQGSSGETGSTALTRVNLLSGDPSGSSDSSADTMSSVSDGEDQSNRMSSSSRKSSASRTSSLRVRGSKSKSKRSNSSIIPNSRDLNFVPTAELVNGRLRPDADPSQLVYRAVLDPGEDGQPPTNPPRLCGLVLVGCQFTAYALSRLIDELCIWDVDLFFVKPGHLFSRPTPASSAEQNGHSAATQTALKTGDESVAAPQGCEQSTLPATQEETIAKFRRGSINLLIATQPAVSAAAGGAELPRCNLVVALQPPRSLAEYLSSKARSRLVDHGAQVVYLVGHQKLDKNETTHSSSLDARGDSCQHFGQREQETDGVLARFQKLEQLLVQSCRSYNLFIDEHDVEPAVADQLIPPVMPRGPNGPKLLLSKAINVINQYCARLPSDYITNLTPRWRLKSIPQPATWTPPAQGPGSSCGAPEEVEAVRRRGLYQCFLRLPINTSVKMEIAGEPMACKKLAKLSAALNAVRALHAAGELDSRWEPSGREPSAGGSNRSNSIGWNNSNGKLNGSFSSLSSLATSETEVDMNDLLATCNPELDEPSATLEVAGRRRQYYFRKFADQMHNCLPQAGDPSPNYLYFIDMRLANALPEFHNTRGRPCFRPEDEPLGFGLLTTKPLHHIPSFPIFSRSGEEIVRLLELWSPLEPEVACNTQLGFPVRGQPLTEEQLEQLFKFHRIVFQAVLRLERDAVIEFNVARAYTQVIVVPIRKDSFSIDWEFISLVLSSYSPEGICRILPRRDLTKTAASPKTFGQSDKSVSPRTGVNRPPGRARASLRARQLGNSSSVDLLFNQPGVFEFRDEDYVNAVVMPGYRNLDQPQHYYVAEIRHDLSPLSPFPSSSYPNFAAYYTNKYEATISTMDQPLLDVDFTVLRLSLLVPRYMNVRGHCLPCSKDGRKRDRRDNLTYKQILIPELCFRHPFPASVWRKAVCLPSVLYRLHSLLLAEELRRRIAYETCLGRARLPHPRRINRSEWNEYRIDPTDVFRDSNLELFEPLRLVFPLQLQHADSKEQTASVTESGQSVATKRRRKRKRHPRSAKEDKSLAEQRNAPETDKPVPVTETSISKVIASDDDEEDTNEDDEAGATEEENELHEEQENHERPKNTCNSKGTERSPKFVKLHASSAVSPCQPSSAGAAGGISHTGLEILLEETKVIEFEETTLTNGVVNPDSEDLILVDNRTNMDKEYLETGSDVESVDSFEGNVRFFPSEDDCEVDSQNEDGVESVFSNLSLNADQQVTTFHDDRAYRPGPANVLQALTMSCSNDFINLERMETIGDSFLKFVATVHLYLTYPNAHEGKLSHMRSRVVCNSNLYRLGRAKNLQDRMIACKFDPYENWVPPGYVVRHDPRLMTKVDNNSSRSPTKQLHKDVNLNIWSTDTLMDDEVLLGTKAYPEEIKPIEDFSISQWDPNSPEVVKTQKSIDHCLVTIQQAIPDKSVADCVEALIGCYLTARGERSALRLMRWFGIDCLPGLDVQLQPRGAPWIVPPPLIPLDDPRRAQLEEARLAWRFDELETKLGYKFRDPALLIQAFTHPSYHQLRKTLPKNPEDDPFSSTFLTDTDCYQRLEFLGDAVLDYVITRFLYEDSQQHSPGVLTDLRSALVNNNIFAALSVRAGLHQFLRASSPQLLHTIDVFVRYQKEVVNDDLDFITNEDIEVRQLEPVDPLSEDQYDQSEKVQPHAAGESSDRNVEDDEVGGIDVALLDAAKEQDDRWQRADAEQLMGNFDDNTTNVGESQSIASEGCTMPTAPPPERSLKSANKTESNNRVSDDVEIPKALGDIFESLAGAIFLDSNLSLDTVWAVFYPLMKERIERYTACIPKSPVRQLLELEPEGTKFERPRRTADGRISVCAHVLGKGRFYGIGRNYRLAKSLAAKRALRVLRKLYASQSLTTDTCSMRDVAS